MVPMSGTPDPVERPEPGTLPSGTPSGAEMPRDPSRPEPVPDDVVRAVVMLLADRRGGAPDAAGG